MSDAEMTSPQRWTKRPIFSPNQLLTAGQLTSLVEGQRAQSEMLMRALHGHGVIFGYAVTPGERERAEPTHDEKNDAIKQADERLKNRKSSVWVGSSRLEISCGMALDRHGRLLRWPTGTLCYGEVVGGKRCAGLYTLRVHYAEKRVGKGGCGPCSDHADWAEEGVVFSLAEGCDRADRACPDHESCTSWDDYICARTASGCDKLPIPDDLASACQGPGELCRIECRDEFYDADAGIAIACVWIGNLADDGCPERWGFLALGETCEVRPYVYRTPLLYELIHGCQNDLARVESLSWQKWCVGFGTVDFDYQVPWKDFAHTFKTAAELTITFTRPISITTVHRGSIFFTATKWDKEADYVLTRRIPANFEPIDPVDGFARTFRIVVNSSWVKNEVSSRSYLKAGGRMELTIRGQMLRDQCGNMLNAVPIAYAPTTPVHSRPGDDFTAIFRFGKAPNEPRSATNQED